MKVTVVCPAYNHGKYIEDALRGFIHQKTEFDFQVLVLDDASTDQTPEIISDYAAKYPDLIKSVLRKENLGVFKNIQGPLLEIKTPYFIFCEGDDHWCCDHFLQKGVDFLEEHPDCQLFCANSVYNDLQGGGQHLWHTNQASAWFGLDNILFSHVSARLMRYRPHFPVGDLAGFHYCLSLGPAYYHSEVVSVYNYTGHGMWSSLSPREARLQLFNKLYLLNKLFDYQYDHIYTPKIITKRSRRRFWNPVKKIMGPEKFWDFYFRWKKYPLPETRMQWWDEEIKSL